MMPPISPFEAEHMQKMVWWQEWLDDDEASEPDMMPVRLAAELVIQTHFRFEGEQQVALAGGQGMAQAAMMAPSAMGQMAMQPEEPQEPAAEDHTAEELEAEAYENDQQRAFDADQAEIDREQEVKLKKMDIEGKVKVAKMKPKPKPAAKAKKK
jgi:septal ring-binding cell division protein DamX